MKFKIGDKVKLIKTGPENFSHYKKGDEFIVEEIGGYNDMFLRHIKGKPNGVHYTYCELVEEDKVGFPLGSTAIKLGLDLSKKYIVVNKSKCSGYSIGDIVTIKESNSDIPYCIRESDGREFAIRLDNLYSFEEPKKEIEESSKYKIGDIVIGGKPERRGVIINIKQSDVVIEIDGEYNDYEGWSNNGDMDVPKNYKPISSNRYSLIPFCTITSHIRIEYIKQKPKEEVSKFKVGDYVKYKNGKAIYIVNSISGDNVSIKHILENNNYNTTIDKLEYVTKEHLSYLDDSGYEYTYERILKYGETIIYKINILEKEANKTIDKSILNTYVILNKDRGAQLDIEWYESKGAIAHIEASQIYFDKAYNILLVDGDGDMLWSDYDSYEDMIQDNKENGYRLISNGIDDKVKSKSVDEPKFKIGDLVQTKDGEVGYIEDIIFHDTYKELYKVEGLISKFTKGYLTKIEEPKGVMKSQGTRSDFAIIDEAVGYDSLMKQVQDNAKDAFAYALQEIILNTNTKPTMSTLSKIQTEEFFSNKKNVKAIEETISELKRLEESFQRVMNDLNNKCSKVRNLRSELSSAVSYDDIKLIQEQLATLKPRIEFLNRYEENTIKELGFVETKATSPEDFFKS